MTAPDAPNFQAPPGGDQNRGPALVIINTILLVIATILVLARLVIRSLAIRNLGLDDLFIVVVLVSHTLLIF